MDAIEFLERVGTDARVFHGSARELWEFAAGTPLEPGLRAALAGRDCDTVYALLGLGLQMGMQVPAEEDEQAPDEDDGDAGSPPSDLRR